MGELVHPSRFSLILLFTFAVGVPGFAFAQDKDAGFTLVNMTGSTIREIYLSPTRRYDWGYDRLGKKVLPDGASRFFKVPPSKSSCARDIRVVFVDDTPSAVWPDVNLCAITKLTLRYDRQAKKVVSETE